MTENPKQDDPNSQAATDEEAKAAAAANFHNMLDQSNHSIESRPSEFLGGDPSLASPTRRKKLVLSPLRSPGTLTPGGDRTLRPEGWLGSPSRRSYVVKKTIPNPLDLDLDDDEDGGGDEEVESPDTTKKQTSTAEVQVPTSNNPQSSSALKTYQETRRSRLPLRCRAVTGTAFARPGFPGCVHRIRRRGSGRSVSATLRSSPERRRIAVAWPRAMRRKG